MDRKNVVAYLLIIVISLCFFCWGLYGNRGELITSSDKYYKAQVHLLTDVKEGHVDMGEPGSGLDSTIENKSIYFTGVFKSGPYKGKQVEMLQFIDYMYAVQPKSVTAGDNIIVSYAQDPLTSQKIWMFIEYDRIGYVIAICLLFCAFIVIIGRKKGLATLLSLVFTCCAIFTVYIPSILNGRNIYMMTVIIAGYIILMSIILINGINKKTLCAILGNIGGVAIAGILTTICSHLFGLTGVVDEDCMILMYVNSAHPIDLRAVVWGSVVIGALGAVMDVAVSLASAMNELAQHMEGRSRLKMIRSGMNIGKDAIGTMTNTLILAYIGGSLATVLLLISSNKTPIHLFNTEMILVEVLQAVVGSTGILFAVPVTVVISAYLFTGRRKSDRLDAEA